MPLDIVDFTIPEPKMHTMQKSALRNMRCPFWTDFFDDTVHKIFQKGGAIIDIGGGLRIDKARGNKINKASHKKFERYLKDPKVDYKVTDYTDQYSPDYVEDIHQLSFTDDSIDSIFCIAVLEHVYDPKQGAQELVRVLKPGGEGLLYVPYIYRYHANVTDDYKDYFRYSKDGIGYLFRECSQVTICPVRGLFESLLRFTPLHNIGLLVSLLRFLDWSSKKMSSISKHQSSGYFIHIVK